MTGPPVLSGTTYIIARMKRLLWLVLLPLATPCFAQNVCSPKALSSTAAQVLSVEQELASAKSGQMEDEVPTAIAGGIEQLKSALGKTADGALACAKPEVAGPELQKSLTQILHANAPDKDNAQYTGEGSDIEVGAYGQHLKAEVSRPRGAPGLLEVIFSFGIECGIDNMLLAYQFRDGHWAPQLRWQSPPLKSISDAFGDLFLTTILTDPAGSDGSDPKWRLVVAHGTSWCTSRFSNFKLDVLAPGLTPATPRVLLHLNRDYSRGDFNARLKSSGNTFEFRVNSPCMDTATYERHVVYRYTVDDDQQIRRVQPIATNARGFVEEWLDSLWPESLEFSAAENANELQKVHDNFDQPRTDTEFVNQTYGPVRACSAQGHFQVQINATLETFVPLKHGWDSRPLPGWYFQLREVKDGYEMVSAPRQPDPTCTGPDLMPPVPNPNK